MALRKGDDVTVDWRFQECEELKVDDYESKGGGEGQ